MLFLFVYLTPGCKYVAFSGLITEPPALLKDKNGIWSRANTAAYSRLAQPQWKRDRPCRFSDVDTTLPSAIVLGKHAAFEWTPAQQACCHREPHAMTWESTFWHIATTTATKKINQTEGPKVTEFNVKYWGQKENKTKQQRFISLKWQIHCSRVKMPCSRVAVH